MDWTSPLGWTLATLGHILSVLLFVFGLLLLSSGWRQLLKTITAFTIAHSITLAATWRRTARSKAVPASMVS